MKKFTIGIFLFLICFSLKSQDCYVGTTMGFALYLQNTCGIVYKEDGIPKNPYQSIKDHGGNMIRLRQDHPPYSNSYVVNEPPVDYRSFTKVKESFQEADQIGLKTMLTFSYQSFALDPDEALNQYVAPLAWQPIANNVSILSDSVYNYTYNTLVELISSGLVPEIVTIGNETNWRILEANVPEDDLPPYDPQRVVTLLNAGTSAVREINENFNVDIKIALHIFGASNLIWWMDTHIALGLDFDIMGLSHYHAWHSLGTFANWTEVVEWVQSNYQKDFMILETAQLFSSGYSDNRVNILGTDNIPDGYPNPPTIITQKDYLADLTKEIVDAGGLGTIVWGGEWVGSDCYIFPDQYGPGSSWENKAFWDFNNNLHDGIDWMAESCQQNSLNELLHEQFFNIYPLPVNSNIITIETKNIQINQISIFTILGEKNFNLDLKPPILDKLTFELPKGLFPAGHYIIQIIDSQNNSYFRKIPII